VTPFPLGASREIFRRAVSDGWTLLTTPYVIDEVLRNLDRLPPSATDDWSAIGRQLSVRPDVLTLDRPSVFGPAKDRPVLFSALAWADVLLTLDEGDFGHLMNQGFYGLRVMRPGRFLEEQRPAQR
jgi:hypothetical protein